MPVQHTCFGRPITLRTPPRRIQLLLGLIVFVVASLSLLGTPSSEDVIDAIKNPHIPTAEDIPKVFGPVAHKPPAAQPNSTAPSPFSDIKWLPDIKWKNPFSFATTLDENTAVLPPFRPRPPIYTYYDPPSKQDKAVSEAEHRLILQWRKAWWAQGFRPRVLSRAEATKHPQYDFVQRLKLEPSMELEIMRWLAWGYMGNGILSNWLALPMAQFDNPMLTFLRGSRYPQLSYIGTLKNSILFGEGASVNHAIDTFTRNTLFKNITANRAKVAVLGKLEGGIMIHLLQKDIAVSEKANGIAYYDKETIDKEYKTVAEKITNTTKAEGLGLLANLINSHLHLTFQEAFPDGVAVVKPLPDHTTALMYEAIEIARNLTQCPTSPIPKSCPPNRLKCTPCDPAKPLNLQLVTSYPNTSSRYIISTVPHPYTLASLHYSRDTLDSDFLRSTAKHNQWVFELTKDILGDQASESERLVYFKKAVANPESAARSLWLTAERVTHEDLDYVFGFNLPQAASSSPDEKSQLVVFARPDAPEPLKPVESTDREWIKTETERLRKAREVLKSKDPKTKSAVEDIEKWNSYDTEAWKFARAWGGRRRVERKVWEEQENGFAGSERKSGVKPASGGLRWTDPRR